MLMGSSGLLKRSSTQAACSGENELLYWIRTWPGVSAVCIEAGGAVGHVT